MIQDLIPSASVNIAVGDSGIGKSPLLYDMCLRVAAGLPFLRYPVKRGPVLIVDFENSGERVQLCETLLHTAGLDKAPSEFLIDPTPGENFAAKIKGNKPGLVLIDSLKLFNPSALAPDGVGALKMLRQLQELAHECGTAFLLIHHIRKQDRETCLPDLETTPVLEWLQEAAGTRSFINQTDVRIAIAERTLAKRRNDDREILVLRHYIKLRCEYGPWYVNRMFNRDGDPIGYERLSDIALMSGEYQQLYNNLPASFRYQEAETLTGKRGGSLAHFLRKCQSLGVLRKDQGVYSKCHRR